MTVLFTTETIAREFDWQLLVASRLAQKGIPSIIGKLAALTTVADATEGGGIVVGRVFEPAFPGVDLARYDRFRARGFGFVHLDEEGAVFQGDEQRWRQVLSRRLDVAALSDADTVCTWGAFQADHYRSMATGATAPSITATGHPRFDLYLPDSRRYFDDARARIRAITTRPYVLINTNISLANHGQGLSYAFSKRAGYDPADAARRIEHLEYWAYANRVLTGLVKLAHRIAVARPDFDVIVRPHPSESLDLYSTILGAIPNVRVTRQEAVGGWIVGATAVIQHGCTTALEAAVAGIPVIDYRVARDPRFDKRLPAAVGLACDTEDAVLEALARPTPASSRTDLDWATHLFANLTSPASPRLLEVLSSLHRPSHGLPDARLRSARRIQLAWDACKRVATIGSARHRRIRGYSASKFAGFTSGFLSGRLQQLARIASPPRVSILDPELLAVLPDGRTI